MPASSCPECGSIAYTNGKGTVSGEAVYFWECTGCSKEWTDTIL